MHYHVLFSSYYRFPPFTFIRNPKYVRRTAGKSKKISTRRARGIHTTRPPPIRAMTTKNANEREHLLAPIQEHELFDRQPSTSSSKYTLFAISAALFALSTIGVAAVSKHALVTSSSSAQLGMMNPSKGFQKIEKAIENSFEVFNRADVHHDPSNSYNTFHQERYDTTTEHRTPLPTLGKKASSSDGPHVVTGAYKPLNEVYEPVLDVPVVFIALRDNDEDLWKVRRTIETLAGETRVNYEDLAETVSISQGIDAKKWPKDIANAEYAVKDIRKLFHKKVKDGTVFASDVKDFYQLMGLLKHIDTRKADGTLDQFSVDRGLSHHVGCLYAHLYQWQWVKDQGWPIAWIMESDGNKMTNVPFWAVQTLTENMPKEADMLFLQNFNKEPGFEGPHFKSVGVRGPNGAFAKIDIYKMNTRASALSGLQSYVITQSFIKKAHNFIATYGADMVDAFTAGNMCAYKDWWNQADISKGEKPILNCFQALSKPIEVEGVKQTMVAG